jgi:hypothetical protein
MNEPTHKIKLITLSLLSSVLAVALIMVLEAGRGYGLL